jgi:hypothetical protein
MPTLTRRRDPDSREEAWLIFYGDVARRYDRHAFGNQSLPVRGVTRQA